MTLNGIHVFLLLQSSRFLTRVQGQSAPCCIQPEINGPTACTTTSWCNQARANCVGACEGTWTGDAPVPSPVVAPAPVASPVASPVTGPTTSGTGRSTYYFGHSLIYHTYTSQPNLNLLGVPYWMNQFALSKNEIWLADGEFRTSNYPLPPIDQWGFQPDISAWDGSFTSTGYDTMVYTELNFVQYKAPTEPYDYDPNLSPVGSVLRILDYSPNTPFILYECWNDGGPSFPQGFPGTNADRDAYYASTDFGSAYHQWWLSLYNEVRALRPDADVTLAPVGPVLVSVLRYFLPNVSFQSLFEDDAPHGRPTVYLIAATVLYIAMTPGGELPSDIGFTPPTDGTIWSEVVSQYADICSYIEDLLSPSSPVAEPHSTPTAPSPVAVPTAPSPVAVPSAPSPVAAPTPTVGNGEPCCIQEEINGPNACTTVPYCNQNESNCLGNCEGIWTVVTGPTPPSPVAPSPVAPSPVAPSPVAPSPVAPSPVAPTTNEPCCIQEEINGPNACTTVPYCNQNESNCIGNCEGIWTAVTGPTPPSPVAPSPVAPSPVAPTTGGDPCCIQEEINGPNACTTVPYCNQNESNCIGNCEGIWTVIGN